MDSVTTTKITGFSQDDVKDWVVHLDCGHQVHTRHHLPWQHRPWALTTETRTERIGTLFDCPYCHRPEPSLAGGPLELINLNVNADWIDYNGHMNVAYYVLAFDKAVDALFLQLGVSEDYVRDQDASLFTLEIHVSYLSEVHKDDPLRIRGQLLDHDEKRIHFFLEMFNASEGTLSATMEQISVHVDMTTRRAAPFPVEVRKVLKILEQQHESLETPLQAGRVMGLGRNHEI